MHSQICMYAQIVHNKMFLPIFPLIEMYFLYTQKGGASNPHDTLLVDYSTIEYPLNKYWEAGRKKTHIPYRHTQYNQPDTKKEVKYILCLSLLFLVWFQDSHSQQ